MGFSCLLSYLTLTLFYQFSFCVPQQSNDTFALRTTGPFKAHIHYADACTDSHKPSIDILISDGKAILDAQGYWVPHDDYQPAMDISLGTDCTDTSWRWFHDNYLDTITGC